MQQYRSGINIRSKKGCGILYIPSQVYKKLATWELSWGVFKRCCFLSDYVGFHLVFWYSGVNLITMSHLVFSKGQRDSLLQLLGNLITLKGWGMCLGVKALSGLGVGRGRDFTLPQRSDAKLEKSTIVLTATDQVMSVNSKGRHFRHSAITREGFRVIKARSYGLLTSNDIPM